MSGTSLFDILAAEGLHGERREGASAGLPWLAQDLVCASMAELERLQLYEERFTSKAVCDATSELAVLRSIFQMYEQWAVDAEQVLIRVRALGPQGLPPDEVNRLDDGVGLIRARLTVDPERIMKSKEQARQGQFVPAKELRDELHARLRT
jgi:hypothetical protein